MLTKIRTRLIATAFVALVPLWIGIAAITAIGRASTREMTINLMEEYIASMTSQLASFFGEAINVASDLAIVQGSAMLDWLDGGWGAIC